MSISYFKVKKENNLNQTRITPSFIIFGVVLLTLCIFSFTGCDLPDSSSGNIPGCGNADSDTDSSADFDNATDTDSSAASDDTTDTDESAANGEEASDTAEKTGAYEQDGDDITESGTSYSATESDQSGVYVYNSGIYTLDSSTITKTGDTSDTTQSDFYGL
ncbi:MAG: hypothetical protein PVI90_20015, partial [Desulfobacteraceae bacterium]